MPLIYPVLLAGGFGKRLWPLSRQSYPKQFAKILNENSLFQNSAQRLCSSSILELKPPIIVTNSEFRFIVGEQLRAVEINTRDILIEPAPKNTAAAILAASLHASSKHEDAILVVAPTDHSISDIPAFHRAISTGVNYLKNENIITFGLKPTRAETGYGYIEIGGFPSSNGTPLDVVRFVEKPDIEAAQKMLQSGKFLWNSGIFLFRAKEMINAFKLFKPQTLKLVKAALEHGVIDLDFLRLASEAWSQLDDTSIDYAIMQKTKNLAVIPLSNKWSDLGDWASVWRETSKDDDGNAVSKGSYIIDCKDTLIRAESPNQKIVGLGLENLIAIAMNDAVLIADKNKSQDVGKVVDLLRAESVEQSNFFPKDYRPWGWYEILAKGNGFQVKRIYVNSGASLSLQSHRHRSEHWVVVNGVATVTIDDDVYSLEAGESTYVHVGATHRLENHASDPMVIIETQIGDYLGEDDIVRYHDPYNRG